MQELNFFEGRNKARIIWFVIYLVLCPVMAFLSTLDTFDISKKIFLICAAVACVVLAIVSIARYFKKTIIIHADKNGVLSEHLFFIPWEHIEKFYIRTGDYSYLLEIKIKDERAFTESLDPDLYAAFADDLEHSLFYGHEMFYFDLAASETEPEKIAESLNKMLKYYTQNA